MLNSTESAAQRIKAKTVLNTLMKHSIVETELRYESVCSVTQSASNRLNFINTAVFTHTHRSSFVKSAALL